MAAAVAALWLVGCGGSPAPQPMPDIAATVEAAVARAMPTDTPTPQPDVEATVAAGVQATVEAMRPTITPTHTPTSTPRPTVTPRPTRTPTRTPRPTPSNTPTYTPTPTSVPTSTPRPTHTRTPTPTRTPIAASTPTPAPTTGRSVADIVDDARPSVVRVLTVGGGGTGFVVGADGYILTNEHVVEGQTQVTVVLHNGARIVARVLSADADRDIALLKVDNNRRLVPLSFASAAREGEEVIALGFPLSLGESMSVTRGIVSAVRTFRGVKYVQTDAAINPGNSGGPLLNDRGEVVGMNTFTRREIEGQDYQAQGIGFAVSFDVLEAQYAAMKSSPSPQSTPVARATPTPILRFTTPTPAAGRGFGPVSGELDHNEDNFIPEKEAFVWLSDTVIEATFVDTFSSEGRDWSHGFLFRAEEQRYYILVISSRGYWALNRRDNVPPYDAIDVQYGFSSNIRTGNNMENNVRVVTLGERGWLFINGAFEAELGLSEISGAGSVSLIGVWFNGHEYPGESTTYKDFSVRPIELEHGPEDGAIAHSDEEGFDIHQSRAWMSNGIIEARVLNPFFVPQGEWFSGFFFRDNIEGKPYLIAITGWGGWIHSSWTGSTWEELANEFEEKITTSRGNANLLLVIALGENGYLFINNSYVADVDLSEWTGRGLVHLVAGVFEGNTGTNVSTQFERFAVWSFAELP